MGRARKPPLVANPKAKAQLEAAAGAAGLSVQELADLVFEAGVTPPKAKDDIIERYTLEDLGKKLWGTMQGVPRTERAAWFEGLVPVQKASVVVVLRDQGYRSEIIARELGIDIGDVMRTFSVYAGQLGAQVVGIRLDTIAGQLQLASERAQEMALEKGDHAAYWRIEKEKVEVLQSIGVVDKAIQKIEHTHKIDDQQKAELEALAALRNKQDRRAIEIKELQETESKPEELPAEVKVDYDED